MYINSVGYLNIFCLQLSWTINLYINVYFVYQLRWQVRYIYFFAQFNNNSNKKNCPTHGFNPTQPNPCRLGASTLLSRGGTSPRTTSPIRLHPWPLNLYASASIVLEISGILRHDLRPNTYIWALHPFNNNNNNRFRI